MRLGLDAFGDHLQPQRPPHVDDRAHDRAVALVAGQALDEATIDLQLPDRDPLQVGQARIAGAEVVDRQPHAEPGQRLQPRQRFLRILDQDRFGQLQVERVGRQARLAQQPGHAVDEVGSVEQQRRDVDRDHQAQPVGVPLCGLAHRLAEHPLADRDDEAALFGHRNELGRRHLAQLRVVPAQQRLGADHAAARQIDLRLVVQPQAPQRQRLAHRVVDTHPGPQVDVLVRLVEAVAGPAAFLHAVHRLVGVAQQGVHRVAVVRVERDADAARHGETQAPMHERARHGLDHALRDGLGAGHVGLVKEHHELVAAEPGHGVDLAHAGGDALGHVDQHLVADPVAERVVDVLEAVEVEEQHRERRAVALRHGQREPGPVRQQAAVGQPGQRIGLRKLLDAPLRGQPVADVAKRIDAPDRAAAAALRQRHPLQHAAGLELEDVAGLQHRRLLDRGQALGVGLRFRHAVQHPGPQRGVVARRQQVARHRPQRGEALVEGADAAGEVGDENAVGSGFERRPQLGQHGFVGVVGAARGAAVVQRDDVDRLGQPVGPLEHDPAHAARHRQQRAVAVLDRGLGDDVLGQPLRNLMPEARVLGCRAERGRGLPAQRGRRHAEQPARRGVGGEDAQRLRTDQPDRVRQALDQRPERARGAGGGHRPRAWWQALRRVRRVRRRGGGGHTTRSASSSRAGSKK